MQNGRINEAKQTIISINTWGQRGDKKEYRQANEVMTALENNMVIASLN